MKTRLRERNTLENAEPKRMEQQATQQDSNTIDHDHHLKPETAAGDILRLQRLQGNDAVRRMLEPPRHAIKVQREEDEEAILTDPVGYDEEMEMDGAVQRETNENASQDKSWLKNWPIGVGVSLRGEVGATFGIPLHLAAGAIIEIRRISLSKMGIFIRKNGTVAADTGFGAEVGAYRGKQGVGLKAAANAQGGLKGSSIIEYQVPFDSIADFLFEYGKDTVLSQVYLDRAVRFLFEKMGWKTIAAYEVSRKDELGLFIQGDAVAMAGVQDRNADGTTVDQTTHDRIGDRQSLGGPTNMLQRWLTLVASLKIGGEIKIGYGTKKLQEKNPNQSRKEYSLSLEAGSTFDLQLPIFNLAGLPVGSGASGISVKAVITTDGEGNQTLEAVTVEIYRKTGELDFYEGAGSQQTIKLTNPAQTLEDLFALLTPNGKTVREVAANAEVEVRQRYDLTQGIGLAFKMFMQNRSGTRMLNVDNKGILDRYGINFGIYLTATFGMNGANVVDMWETIKPAVQEAISSMKGTTLAQIQEALQNFTTSFEKMKGYEKLEKLLFDHVKVKEGMYRVMFELGLGAQGKVAAAVKARLEGFGMAGGFFDRDLVKPDDLDITKDGEMKLSDFLTAAANEYNNIMTKINEILAWLIDQPVTPGDTLGGQKTTGDGLGIGDGKKKPTTSGGIGDTQKQSVPVESTEAETARVQQTNDKRPDKVVTGSAIFRYDPRTKLMYALVSVTRKVQTSRGLRSKTYNARFPLIYEVDKRRNQLLVNLPGTMTLTDKQGRVITKFYPYDQAKPIPMRDISGYPVPGR
jgi:hypothetical protein